MPRARTFDLLAMLREPTTRQVLGALATGADPRELAADTAVALFRREIQKALGAPATASRVDSATGARKMDERSSDIIDVEYRVIDVTPGVKKRVKGSGT